MIKTEEQKLEADGYEVTSRCTDGSPVMQKQYDPGVTHVIWGHPDNDYWAAEFGDRIEQCGSRQKAKTLVEQMKK